MTQHSPGPWHIDDDRGVVYYETPGNNRRVDICRLLPSDRRGHDARIIASALDVLAALQGLLDARPLPDDLRRVPDCVVAAYDAASAAIALAKGEE